jgi:hypothetical protein
MFSTIVPSDPNATLDARRFVGWTLTHFDKGLVSMISRIAWRTSALNLGDWSVSMK